MREIAVDQASALMALGCDARGLKRIGVSLALISQRIEPETMRAIQNLEPSARTPDR